MIKNWIMLLVIILSACTGIPGNIKPVGQFKLDKYLGRWYEIARLDQRFERGLSRVTADYSLRDDGGVRVINRGFSAEDKQWHEAEGKAYFVGQPDQAYLKVSFFGPFYGAYIVFELDKENYQYSLISGPDKSYLWLLARQPTLDAATQKMLVHKAAALGFDTGKLIYVNHKTGEGND